MRVEVNQQQRRDSDQRRHLQACGHGRHGGIDDRRIELFHEKGLLKEPADIFALTEKSDKVSKALADHRINIQMISTSEIKISCVISRVQVEDAVKVLHQEFALAKKIKSR